jgi:hypothetical protein
VKCGIAVSLVVACLCASCGIFSPRPVEYPTVTVVDDPFNFASILWNTGKTFTKLEYSDLFADECTFIDINGNTFNKDDIRNHLTTIQQELTINSSTWQPDTANPDLFMSDTLFIANRIYNVAAKDQRDSSYSFYGKASLKVLFNSTENAWTILEWKDEFPGPGYSVFHPWFSPN